MASLFDHNFRYPDRARAIFKGLQRNLCPILLEEGACGQRSFSPREIAALITSAAAQRENAAIAEWEEGQRGSHNSKESQTMA
ncbi:hypothetical protein [Thermosynechococcus sp.]|uniref:hypothetical protein n=1 Tax=Thermosynechococcus sp. TaxID=2814275 RepID=UPI00391D6243